MSGRALIIALEFVMVGVGFAWPRSRQKLTVWTRLIIETPLRVVTGRWRPDYATIAQLERTELQR